MMDWKCTIFIILILFIGKVDDNIVKWLMAIPISDNELEYLNNNGVDAFENLLEQNDTEVFDIYRKSII